MCELEYGRDIRNVRTLSFRLRGFPVTPSVIPSSLGTLFSILDLSFLNFAALVCTSLLKTFTNLALVYGVGYGML